MTQYVDHVAAVLKTMYSKQQWALHLAGMKSEDRAVLLSILAQQLDVHWPIPELLGVSGVEGAGAPRRTPRGEIDGYMKPHHPGVGDGPTGRGERASHRIS